MKVSFKPPCYIIILLFHILFSQNVNESVLGKSSLTCHSSNTTFSLTSHSSMEKLLKPDKLDAAPGSTMEWIYFKQTFDNFVASF